MVIPEMGTLIIYLLLGVVIVCIAAAALNQVALPQPWRGVAIVVLAIIAILFLLRLFGMA